MKATKDFYLDGLRRMDWDTFRFGSYNLKDWHYDEILGFLNRLENNIFPLDDWKVVKTSKGIAYNGKQQFDLYDVEEYIKRCNDMLVTPTLERLFDIECRNLFREGKVIIDGRILTIAEARTYVEQKIKNQLRIIYNFNGD